MQKKTPLVSIIILSWNTLEDTKACIRSVRDLTYTSAEIVVVDNGSNDGSKDYLSTQKDIVYIDLAENTGFTGGQIAALEKASGEYLLLVNSDAILANDWIDTALEVFSTDESIGAIGGKAYEWNDDNPVFNTSNQFYTYQVVDRNLGYASTMRAGESRIDVDSISGAVVMIKRSAIDKCGYFDDRFFAYYEETDLFARFQKAGYKIVYEPSLHAWHQVAKSTRSKPYFYFYHMHRNRFMFAYKNFDATKNFVSEYTFDFVRAVRRLKRHPESLDDKARVEAYKWNLSNITRTRIDRRFTQKHLQHSYLQSLKSHQPGRDVTVVIPSYNYSDYLADCIESVLAQTVQPSRIIVIDDGSTDDSVSIAQSYKGVEVIAKKNEGVVVTKNLGIKLSTTTWTMFLDADDILEKHYIEKTLDSALKQTADIVYTDMEYIGAKKGHFPAKPFSLSELLDGNYIHNSSLINTTLLKNTGGYKVAMNGGYEDWELYLNLAEANAKFFYCRESVLFYRQHEGSLSRNNSALDVQKKLRQHVRELHESLYSRNNRSKRTIIKASRLLMKYPETPIVSIIALPIALVKGSKDYVKAVKRHEVDTVRSYIHKRRYKTKSE